MKILVLSLILSFLGFKGFCQQIKQKVIEGRLLDAETKQPLAYASVTLQGTTLGTVSNESGYFYLILPDSLIQPVIVFSYIGYITSKVNAEQILQQGASFVVNLSIDPQTLEAVTITTQKLTGKDIMRKCVKRFPKNYYTYLYELTGFFRWYSFSPWTEPHHLALSEALVKIQDEGVNTYADTSIVMQILQLRQGNTYLPFSFGDSLRSSILLYAISGQTHYNELFETYGVDEVRHLKGSRLFTYSAFREMEKFQFNLEGIVKIDSMPCYQITTDAYNEKYYLQQQKEIQGRKEKGVDYESYKYLFPKNTPKKVIDSLRRKFNQRSDSTIQIEFRKYRHVFYINVEDFALVRHEKEYYLYDLPNPKDTSEPVVWYYQQQVQYQKNGKKYIPKFLQLLKVDANRKAKPEAPARNLGYKNNYKLCTWVFTGLKVKKIKRIPSKDRFTSSMYLEKLQLPYRPAEWSSVVQSPFDPTVPTLVKEKIEKFLEGK